MAMEKKKGHWSSEEDDILRQYVTVHGVGNWHLIENNSALSRSGKSCRLRWLDHLRPDLKKGPITNEEEKLLIELHKNMGNKWAQITKHFPGRTDNELKNFWHKRIRRCRRTGLALYPVDDGFSIASHQNHQQQIDGPPLPSGDVFDPNIICNSTAADEDQTGCTSKRQKKSDRNSSFHEASEWGNINDEDFFNSCEIDVGIIAFQDPSLYENPAAIITERNEILENSEEEHVPVQLDLSMPDEAATHLEQKFCKERKIGVSEPINNYELSLAQNDYHSQCEPKNSAPIIKNNEILDNSVVGSEDKYDLSQLEETLLKDYYLVATSNSKSEDEIATLLKPYVCNEHKIELSEAISYGQPLAQDDHNFECESLNTTTCLPKNNEILDNSVVGLMDEHVLPQQDFSMPYEQLEETQLKEDDLVVNFYPMSEDEIAFLKQDFCFEHKMTLSEAIDCEHPLVQYDRQFESESGDTANGKKEATAVDVEPLPIATMEESLEQSWSNDSWNEIFSGCNLAMDWELTSIQNNDFDGLWNDIYLQDV